MFDEIEKLIYATSGLPVKYVKEIGPLAIRIREIYKKQTKLIQEVQKRISDLRLQVKYLIFDLEATRRERDEYKARLDNPNV